MRYWVRQGRRWASWWSRFLAWLWLRSTLASSKSIAKLSGSSHTVPRLECCPTSRTNGHAWVSETIGWQGSVQTLRSRLCRPGLCPSPLHSMSILCLLFQRWKTRLNKGWVCWACSSSRSSNAPLATHNKDPTFRPSPWAASSAPLLLARWVCCLSWSPQQSFQSFLSARWVSAHSPSWLSNECPTVGKSRWSSCWLDLPSLHRRLRTLL